MSGRVSDAGAGPGANGSFQVTDEYGELQPSGTFAVGGDGTYSFTISLEAKRDGKDKDGRTFTIRVSATDAAGNPGSTTATVTVPQGGSGNGSGNGNAKSK